jgi:hypothetical protein
MMDEVGWQEIGYGMEGMVYDLMMVPFFFWLGFIKRYTMAMSM